MSIEQRQKFLGHAKLENTQVYTESTPEMSKDSYQRALSKQRYREEKPLHSENDATHFSARLRLARLAYGRAERAYWRSCRGRVRRSFISTRFMSFQDSSFTFGDAGCQPPKNLVFNNGTPCAVLLARVTPEQACEAAKLKATLRKPRTSLSVMPKLRIRAVR
jgi:hypothetical protein